MGCITTYLEPEFVLSIYSAYQPQLNYMAVNILPYSQELYVENRKVEESRIGYNVHLVVARYHEHIMNLREIFWLSCSHLHRSVITGYWVQLGGLWKAQRNIHFTTT